MTLKRSELKGKTTKEIKQILRKTPPAQLDIGCRVSLNRYEIEEIKRRLNELEKSKR